MVFLVRLMLLMMIPLIMPAAADAGEIDIDRKLKEAVAVLDEINAIPEQAIPPQLLANAHAVVVIPELVKAGFIIGARHGSGLMMVRDLKGYWHYPVVVNMTGASIGWQAGAQSTDVVFVFKSMESVDAIEKGKFTLGADASIAAGPVGRHAEAGTDLTMKSEIYSYSRSRGLFAGVSFEGTALQIDQDATWKLYSLPVYDVLHKTRVKRAPEGATKLRKTLLDYLK